MFHNHKSGVQTADREKIAQIIEETSKGSQFYLHEQRSLQRILAKVDEYREKLEYFKQEDFERASKELETKIEKAKFDLFHRQTEKFFVHFDMDAFYAAVETLHRPELANVPMAVGGEASNSILCTANYEARKFGVTSAMPVFIAKKLCPQLIILNVDFSKYEYYGNVIRKIFASYDGNFRSFSLDEANLDLSDYVMKSGLPIEEVVGKIKSEIFHQTHLTCSAGIACNRLLAKICSNVNKPNGIFRLEFGVEVTEAFLANLPVRKLHGIGKVSERLLYELFGIKNCQDIWKNRVEIYMLFNSTFWIELSYGLNQEYEKEPEKQRKSVSYQRSFRPLENSEQQLKILQNAVENVVSELKALELHSKTISIRYKKTSFDSVSRNASLNAPTCDKLVIYEIAKELLEKEQPITIRLLGVAVGNLSSIHRNEVGIEKVR